MQLRLPLPKLQGLQAMVNCWLTRRSATKRELLSLIGHCQHAASVVKPGQTFLRHLIDLAASARSLHHRVHVRGRTRSDLYLWSLFLERWNRNSMIPPPTPTYTFASGGWGCGAIWRNDWLQLQWPGTWAWVNIAVKELVPVVLAVACWGQQWKQTRVQVQCDNMAVVSAINSGCTRHYKIMQLLRCLHFYCAELGITLTATHLRGSLNQVADAISRNNLSFFHVLVPQASATPRTLLPSLVQLLLEESVDWTSRRWRRLFHSSLGEALRLPPRGPMVQEHDDT